jgi:hypothetical protein
MMVSLQKSRAMSVARRCVIACLIALSLTITVRADAVLEWTDLMVDAIRLQNSAPTLASRNLAILHTAIYDAVNSVAKTSQPYLYGRSAPPGTDPEAAAVGAAYYVVTALYPSAAPMADELYNTYASGAPQSAARMDGIVLGTQVGQAVIAARANDGATRDVPYVPFDEPGDWRRTPPFFRPPVDTQWRYVTPFALHEIEQFVPPGPPVLESEEWARDFNLTKDYGRANSSIRTADQTQIARFWSDFSYTATPPGHWHEIAISIAQTKNNSLTENARLFALLSLAQADGAIVCWESKYRHNFWRPPTAIARGDLDGNPMTEQDTNWVSLLPSPSFPEYTSGHSTFSKGSATILSEFYGTDAISFSATSDSLPGVFRHFTSLAACADEIGMSRIYGGIHFLSANVDGKKCGDEIARYVLANYLQPNEKLPCVLMERGVGGGRVLRVHGHAAKECIVQGSSDLQNWTSLSTNTAVVGGFTVTISNSSSGAGFFRVLEN